jgi:hypothetical protein
MKGVSVHVFIPRDELTVDIALTVKKKLQHYLSFTPVDLKFFASK